MDISDFLYYCTFAVTVGLALVALFLSHRAIRKGGNKTIYANRFVVASVLAGMISGILFYYGILWVFDTVGDHINVGHGEVLIASPLFNFVLGLTLAMLGRILLVWRPLRP